VQSKPVRIPPDILEEIKELAEKHELKPRDLLLWCLKEGYRIARNLDRNGVKLRIIVEAEKHGRPRAKA